jgi:hypothetical protein
MRPISVVAQSDNRTNETAPSVRGAVSTFTFALAAAGSLVSILLLFIDPWLAIAATAVMFGWSEMDGLCGTSHVCTLTPLRAFSSRIDVWWKSVFAYTLAGTATSASVGLLLGSAGAFGIGRSGQILYAILALLSVSLAARELGLLRFPLPQIRRQTHKMWAFEFGIVTAAGMWGAHIGLGFATVIKHGGYFVLVGLACLGGPKFGAAVLAAYWLGRSLPLWLVPVLTRRWDDGGHIGNLVGASASACRYLAASGLVVAAAAISFLGAQ